MEDQRPWSRWLLNLVLPGRINDTFALRSPQVLLTESESKLLARYAAAADHLVAGPQVQNVPAVQSVEPREKAKEPSGHPPIAPVPVSEGARSQAMPLQEPQIQNPPVGHRPSPVAPAPLPSSPMPASPITRSGLGVGSPPRTTGNIGLGIVGVTVSSAWPASPSRATAMGTIALADDAPSVAALPPTRRRPRMLNKLTLGSASPSLTATPPSTPFDGAMRPPRYPQTKVRPALATLERAAACALYFEQFYSSLQRTRGPAIGGGRQRRGRASAETFDFGRVIGQGAFGVVRIAKERENGRMVAIKQLRKVDLLRMGQEGHVRAEKDLLSAAAMHRLDGPSWIPQLYYSFQDEDHLFFVLEFMGGGDLLTLLVDRGSLPEPMVRFYAAEMILALHQTHRLGYIHRDVKPDNFLFTSDGHIRIADFGLATDLHWAHDSAYYEHQRRSFLKRHGVPLDRPAFGNRRREVEGMQGGAGTTSSSRNLLSWRSKNRRKLAYTICGTNSYMAPEVIRGNGYGFGVDWWGLGVIIYEAIYGTIPFVGNTREQTRKKILEWKTQLHFPRRGVSPLAIDFMRSLLCDPEDRLGYTGVGRRASAASVIGSLRGAGASVLSLATTDIGSVSACASASNGWVSVLDGPLGHDGVEQLMAHPWFQDLDWATLHEMYPPFQPALQSEDDTRHFDDDIPDEPLAPGNSALYLRDPLLGDKICGKDVLAIRKNLAFKGWTFRSEADEQRGTAWNSSRPVAGNGLNSSFSDYSLSKASDDKTTCTHRSRQDMSRTIRGPEQEPTMRSLYPFSPAEAADSDSDFSDPETEVEWGADDIEVDADGSRIGGNNTSLESADMPNPETPEVGIEADDDDVIGGVVDSYLPPADHSYGFPRPTRRLWPRGVVEPFPRYSALNSLERAYDDNWWETQQLDWREMLALGHPEDYVRPSCVPADDHPRGRSGGSPASGADADANAPPALDTTESLCETPGSISRSKSKMLPRVARPPPSGRERASSMPPVTIVSLKA